LISKDILKKIKRIEITTKHLVNTVLQGEYLSSFKGRGVEFSEVREYAEGDDIRAIDWNVTARMNAPFVKTFIEERELQVFFAADMSGSLGFGSMENTKTELMFEFTAALGFTASVNNDRVGFMGFSSGVEKYIPPKKGRKHVLRIIREILYHKKKGEGTNIAAALMHLAHILKKRSTIFLISDFYDAGDFRDALKAVRHRHDVIAVVLRDRADSAVPDMGIVPFYDAEAGREIWINTSDRAAAARYEKHAAAAEARLQKIFRAAGVDVITLTCGRPYIKDLTAFFKKREKRGAR